MAIYRIENLTSGAVLGNFEADSESEALDKMARGAGYRSYVEGCKKPPISWIEIYVAKEGKRFRTLADLRRHLDEHFGANNHRVTDWGELNIFGPNPKGGEVEWRSAGYLYEWVDEWAMVNADTWALVERGEADEDRSELDRLIFVECKTHRPISRLPQAQLPRHDAFHFGGPSTPATAIVSTRGIRHVLALAWRHLRRREISWR